MPAMGHLASGPALMAWLKPHNTTPSVAWRLLSACNSAAYSVSAAPLSAAPAAASSASQTEVPKSARAAASTEHRGAGPTSTSSSRSSEADIPALLTTDPLTQLGPAHYGAYYRCQLRQRVPEALGSYYVKFHETRDGGHRRRGGCHGIKDELQYSHGGCLMYRQCTHQLISWLDARSTPSPPPPQPTTSAAPLQLATSADSSSSLQPAGASAGVSSEGSDDEEHDVEPASDIGEGSRARDSGAPGRRRLLLRGPVGSGKSVTLVSLVEWARDSGWIVMYVASAQSLTRGGFFIQRPNTADGAPPLFDTPIAAKLILQSVLDAHRQQLQGLACRGAGRAGRSLADLAQAGVDAKDDAQLAVETCLALRDELLAASDTSRVLFAIDDYNSLYWQTGYGTAPPPRPPVLLPGRFSPALEVQRTPVTVDQLPLAKGFRMLQAQAGHSAAVVAAVGWSHGVSRRVRIPVVGGDVFYVPRYSQTEVANALGYYHQCGLSPEAPSRRQVEQLLALTNGNGKELREMVPQMGLLKLNLV